MGGLVVVLAFACVGSEPDTANPGIQPDPNVPAGELRGRCNQGRCLGDLVCDTKNDVCLNPDFPDGGGPPVTGSDGGGGNGDAGNDAANPVPCPFTKSSTVVACPNATDAGAASSCVDSATVCCLSSFGNSCAQNDGDCTTLFGKVHKCGGKAHCTNGERCCLTTAKTFSVADACPSTQSLAQMSETRCSPLCAAGAVQVCQSDAECDAPAKCRRLVIQNDGTGDVEVGICL